MEPRAGERFGPYEIISRIGAGGMGEVWRARDTRLKREVAIKFLAPHMAQDQHLRRRFDLEATAVARLAHPNICRIYDVGDSYIVMELLDGHTLAGRMSRGPMSVEETLRYGAELAAGLAAAHERGIVHRDLKPGNVMITKLGVKLLDFGLATTASTPSLPSDALTAPMAPLTKEGTIMGTFQYMAPEQLEGREVDARSDIFALGVVLFEMLAGVHPFIRPTRDATVAALLGQAWPSLREYRDDVPQFLQAIVERCVARDPAERWQSAADLAWMLRWVSAGAEDLTPTRRAAGKRKRWLGLLAGAALLIAGVVSVPMLTRDREEGTPTGPPRVILVDSTLPERVYSSETRANGATNADDLIEILRDLPVTLVKENTNSLWSREDQVLKENPALIISHRGALAAPVEGIAEGELRSRFVLADRRVQSFLGYVGLGSARTQFIVYSRNWEDVGGEQTWVRRVVARYPHLQGRLTTIHVTGVPEPSFRDPASAARIRAEVVRVLKLDRALASSRP